MKPVARDNLSALVRARSCSSASKLLPYAPDKRPLTDSWLHEEGLYEEVTGAAIKRVLSRQIAEAMAEKNITKTEMASRMHTSRSALDRLLDPQQESVTLSTLRKAAQVVGRQLRVELV